MRDLNFNTVNAAQSLSHSLCEIDGTVLPTGASEGDLQMFAAIAPIFLD